MKRYSVIALITVLVLGLAVYLGACWGGGGGGGGGGTVVTAITTTTQGAQTAAASKNVVGTVTSGSISLTNLLDNTNKGAPKFPETRMSKTIKTVSSKLAPRVAKAKALWKARAVNIMSAPTTTDVPCAVSGKIVATFDDAVLSASLDFQNCQEYDEIINGLLSFSCSDNQCSGMNVTFGNGSTAFVDTKYYTGSGYTNKEWEDTALATMTVVVSAGTGSSVSVAISGNGSMVDTQYVQGSPTTLNPNYRATVTLTSFSVVDEFGFSSTSFNDKFTANGSTEASIAEDTGAGFVTIYGEKDSFTNLVVNWGLDTNTNIETYSIDGAFGIQFTPANTCVDGTYSFVTNTPVTYDYNTGMYTGGQITINGTVVVKYLADGSVQVSIDGGTTFTDFTDTQFDQICPDL